MDAYTVEPAFTNGLEQIVSETLSNLAKEWGLLLYGLQTRSTTLRLRRTSYEKLQVSHLCIMRTMHALFERLYAGIQRTTDSPHLRFDSNTTFTPNQGGYFSRDLRDRFLDVRSNRNVLGHYDTFGGGNLWQLRLTETYRKSF